MFISRRVSIHKGVWSKKKDGSDFAHVSSQVFGRAAGPLSVGFLGLCCLAFVLLNVSACVGSLVFQVLFFKFVFGISDADAVVFGAQNFYLTHLHLGGTLWGRGSSRKNSLVSGVGF